MIKFNQHCFKGQAKTVHILEGILICVLFFSSCVVTPVVSTPIDDTVKPDSTPLLINNSYILFSPMLSTTTYLINQDTTVIHRWESNYIPRCSVYLLEDGSILRPAYVSANPVFICGGVGGGVEIIDWYSQVLWQFEYTTSNYCLHHDVEILPNGNILMIAWERKSASEAIAAGRNPDLLAFGELWPDHIIEVQPTGQEGGTIVWEWHIWDHLIQDYDPIRPNYGVVSDHPELINLNYGDADADWNHVNSIDYNEKLDQILLSVHDFGEIWVIDHSTTTTEAAGHSGGLYGRGGDILYRWGNPQAYDHGEDTDQQLFRQHDAEWITDEIPGAGNILIFNNGYGRPGNDYSSIIEIITPVGTDGNYTYTYGLPYEPIVPIWEYKAPNPSSFFSMILSGSQRLPNGNTLICNGYPGYFFEVTSYGEIVWDYTNPYPNSVQNQVFNLQQYQKNYPGLYHLQDNEPPEQPARPEGPSQGRKGETYTYTTYANDPEGQEIYYLFDWGDKTTSTWEGPYNSGEVVSMPHRWLSLQRIFKIRVKAMDSTGIESEWSLPLTVSMSVIKNSIIPWLSGFFSHHPILAWLVTLLNNLLPVLP